MRIVVTGAGGFIGRRALDALADRGFEIHAVARGDVASRVPGVRWHVCDLLVPGEPTRLIERVRPTHVLHLAWYTAPGAYWSSDLNLDWLGSTVELARAFGARGGARFVGAGTCAEYAWSGGPCDEVSTPLVPATFYGAVKHATGVAVAAIMRKHAISFAWGRVFFAYGPGEDDGKLLTSTALRLLRHESIVLRQARRRLDFIHVDDVGVAFARLVEGTAVGPVNVATGIGTRIEDAVALLSRVAGRIVPLEVDDAAPEPDVVSGAGQIVGRRDWNPRSLAEGLRSVVTSLEI